MDQGGHRGLIRTIPSRGSSQTKGEENDNGSQEEEEEEEDAKSAAASWRIQGRDHKQNFMSYSTLAVVDLGKASTTAEYLCLSPLIWSHRSVLLIC